MGAPRPDPAQLWARVEDLESTLRYLAMAWDNLCECVDEFEPNDMQACSEHRDALDRAILRAIKAVEPNRQ